MNLVLIAGALLGFIATAMAAYSEHVLKASITPDLFHFLMMAVRNNQVHAILITAIGLCLFAPLKAVTAKRLAISAWVFVFSTFVFSFSIYLSIMTGFSLFNLAAPIGGALSILAWLMLVWAACAKEKEAATQDYYYFRKPTK